MDDPAFDPSDYKHSIHDAFGLYISTDHEWSAIRSPHRPIQRRHVGTETEHSDLVLQDRTSSLLLLSSFPTQRLTRQ